ncbi:hypothetical protein LXL04_017219 [Taraxacum kok-saghyz]
MFQLQLHCGCKPNSDSECTPGPHRCKSLTPGRTTAAPTPVRTTAAPQQVAPPQRTIELRTSATLGTESRSEQPPIVDVEEDEEVAENRGGGHKKSWVWDHFDQEALKKGVKKLKCPYCTTEVIDATRSSLTHVTAEALICTQDWIRNTPVDIQFKQITAAILEEQRERLAKIELDTLGNSEECGLDDIDD